MEGLIIKGIGGFYYVKTEEGELVECRARGRFRNEDECPLVGDRVVLGRVHVDSDGLTGSVDEILPRKNQFIRPPVANIDQMLITFAVREPAPNLFLVDKLTVTAVAAGVDCLICINKIDLSPREAEGLASIYRSAGFRVFLTSGTEGDGTKELGEALAGRVTALAGNSGVGKSSVLNQIDAGFHLATGGLSGKIRRGRHTTRHTELLPLSGGGYVFDTPGFGSYEVAGIRAAELWRLFPEMAFAEGKCRFKGCSHIAEPGCPVREAAESGGIARSRYESYKELYHSLKDIKEWMRND